MLTEKDIEIAKINLCKEIFGNLKNRTMTYVTFKNKIPFIYGKEVKNKEFLIEIINIAFVSKDFKIESGVEYGLCRLHYVNDGDMIFVVANNLLRRLPTEPCNCGVGYDVHGTNCGWGNASAVCDELRICDDRHPFYNKHVNEWINSSEFLSLRC